jgi:hypothetical protein
MRPFIWAGALAAATLAIRLLRQPQANRRWNRALIRKRRVPQARFEPGHRAETRNATVYAWVTRSLIGMNGAQALPA